MGRIAYFDCFSGAAGDMIVGACLDAGAAPETLRTELGKLKLAEVSLAIEKTVRGGITATSFRPVMQGAADSEHKHEHAHGHDHGHGGRHNPADTAGHKHPEEHGHTHTHTHEHEHTHGHEHTHTHPHDHGHAHGPDRRLGDIAALIKDAGLSEAVTEQSLAIFGRLAKAEAKVHGIGVDEVHFHEVGAADAICDIVGACVALEALGVKQLNCSVPVVGWGTVHCAHGVLPVPAPATVELLKGVAVETGEQAGEFMTPTGAAILTTLAQSFGRMEPMRVEAVGYGAGQRELAGRPNVLRVLVGEATKGSLGADQVVLLEANLDDATAEVIGYVSERLLEAGALDVYTSAVMMKKNRPGTLVSVLARPGETAALERVLFLESTTLGVRRRVCERSVLQRGRETVATRFGPIAVKVGYLEDRAVTASPEFEDCRAAALRCKVALKDVIAAALAAYQNV